MRLPENSARERLALAAELLDGQSIPVELIARLAGYSGGSSFARAFRRRYRTSPARYRAEARAARRSGRGRPAGGRISSPTRGATDPGS